jgi:hypothetical protein
VKFAHAVTSLAACLAILVPVTGAAAGPELKIPDFSQLHSKATESTDITIDGVLLKIAKQFAKAHEEDDQEALSILSDIKSVRVRSFQFDSDDAYSQADVESVRKQLAAPGWSPLVQTHTREPREDVDVFLNTDDGKIRGVAVVTMEPRGFTIVNIIGNIDIEKLAKIEGQLGIPKVSQAD